MNAEHVEQLLQAATRTMDNAESLVAEGHSPGSVAVRGCAKRVSVQVYEAQMALVEGGLMRSEPRLVDWSHDLTKRLAALRVPV